MIKFRCAHCQQKLGVPDEYAGRRVRCSKCSQANVVPTPQSPEPMAEPHAVSAPSLDMSAGSPPDAEGDPSIQLDFDGAPPPSVAEDIFSDLAGMEVVQEDPNLEAVRAARQETAAKRVPVSRSEKKTKAAKSAAGRESKERTPIADMVPSTLHLPLALALGVIAASATAVIWIMVARSTQKPLGIFALLVAAATAGAMRIFVVNRGLLWGALGTLLAAAAIVGGKAAVIKYVAVPAYEKQANEECLKDLGALLKNEKYQFPQGESAKVFATDHDLLTCIALVSLVDDGQADPVKARAWALHILEVSNKTNFLAMVADAGAHSYESTLPELDAEGEAVFDKAYQRMGQWQDEDLALRNTRKYYPALECLAEQCICLRVLKDPQRAFTVALIDTLNLFDVIWILLGMGFSYIALALD